MKFKSVPTGALRWGALDWAVAKANGEDVFLIMNDCGVQPAIRHRHGFDYAAYSSLWVEGGPIIDREKISLEGRSIAWLAYYYNPKGQPLKILAGETALEAAMRCYVASKLGDEVDIPEELCQ